ncbi:DUF4262 domain-containing protein [Ornithinimicrobium sp. Y1847]|uniref:DUF4262 domain-containing protein n=1 Tax=unclassified Ornithinimicrobium TaxID=2615080 RepID=UPI003B673E53
MTVTPAMQAFWDQERRSIIDHIRRFGVHLTYVSDEVGQDCAACAFCRTTNPAGEESVPDREPTGPAFCYTTGLYGVGHPELLVFDLGQAEALVVLNSLTRQVIEGGKDLVHGQQLQVGSRQLFVEEVPNPGDIVFDANGFYERPPEVSVPVLQLTWADAEDRFPWDEGHQPGRWPQPRPGDFSA